MGRGGLDSRGGLPVRSAREMVDELAEGAMLVTSYDDCIVGIGHRIGLPPLVVYDKAKIITKLIENDQMNPDEAEEYFNYNILGSYVGEATPIFTDIFKPQPITAAGRATARSRKRRV